MYRVLAAAVLAACMAFISAPVLARPAAMATASAARTTLQPGAGAVAVKVSTKHSEPPARSISQGSAGQPPRADGSGWRTYSTLLATLALMGVIALRRQRFGRH